jgi:hypothetical protein
MYCESKVCIVIEKATVFLLATKAFCRDGWAIDGKLRIVLMPKIIQFFLCCSSVVFGFCVRIPAQNSQRSGGKTATIPLRKRPVFRWECGHHSGENGQYTLRV